jgi:hypothetical protein
MAGAGHGTYAPFLFSSGLLALLLPLGGFCVALLGTPLLWGAYFLLMPIVNSRSGRIAIATVIVVLHSAIGIWPIRSMEFFQHDLQRQGAGLITFFLMFAISSVLLILVSVRRKTAND